MKKLTILVVAVFGSILFFTSCQSHGPKCPGMYSQVDNVQVQNVQNSPNQD